MAVWTLGLDLQEPFMNNGGHCWIIDLPNLVAFADRPEEPERSPIQVLENGVRLENAHVAHSEIRSEGRGRHSYWLGRLYFSTSDNSDPNLNGRAYRVELPLSDQKFEPHAPLQIASELGTEAARLAEIAIHDGTEKHFVEDFLAPMQDKSGNRTKYYHLLEYMFAHLMDDLLITQSASARTVNIFSQYIDIFAKHAGGFSGKDVVEIGPGRNLSAGIAFRLLGATSFTGIEIETGENFNSYATLNSAEKLIRFRYSPFLDNFNRINLGFTGQTPARIDDEVDLTGNRIFLRKPEEFEKIPLDDGSSDYLYSNFTLEHIQSPNNFFSEVARILRPGGLTAHFIDIEDHSNFNEPFNYLVHSDEEWNDRYGEGKVPYWMYENRARASDFRTLCMAAGLEILESQALRSAALPQDLWERIDPRFKAYARDDLETVWYVLVARKPR